MSPIQHAPAESPKRARRSVSRRAAALAAVATVVAVLAAGCSAPSPSAGQTSGSPSPTPSITATAASNFSPSDPLLVGTPSGRTSDAIGLIGFWQVTLAVGEKPGTILRISADAGVPQLTLFRICGYLTTAWVASDTKFLAGSPTGSSACFYHPDVAAPTITWLEATRGFHGSNGGWDLLDASGAIIARLDRSPPPSVLPPDAPADLVSVPVLDQTVLQTLRVAAPLPKTLTPATADDLVGTWSVVGPGAPVVATASAPAPGAGSKTTPSPAAVAAAATAPTITFSADDRMVVHDCGTTTSGASSVDSAGSEALWTGDGTDFLVEPTPGTTSRCSPSWPGYETRTRTIARDNGYLRLFDIDGNEIGRLQRVGA